MDTCRFQIGSINALAICDGRKPLTQALIERIFVQDPARMLAEWRSGQAFCRNILYLETDGRRVLIDGGEGHNDTAQPGQLVTLLRAEAIDPASISTVILTHFHIDHFGGLLDLVGKPNFPNARVVTSRAEYDYWMQGEGLAKLQPERADLLRRTLAAYPVDFAAAADLIEPGVRLIAAPGHTPGHVAADGGVAGRAAAAHGRYRARRAAASRAGLRAALRRSAGDRCRDPRSPVSTRRGRAAAGHGVSLHVSGLGLRSAGHGRSAQVESLSRSRRMRSTTRRTPCVEAFAGNVRYESCAGHGVPCPYNTCHEGIII